MPPATPAPSPRPFHPPLLRQAWRMTVRDWRAGELTMLLLALVLAVAALSSVGFLADRLTRGLERDARQMIGADLVVRADHPLEPQFAAQARSLGLQTADTTVFPSMVTAAPAGAAGTDRADLAAASAPQAASAANAASVTAGDAMLDAGTDTPSRLAAIKAVSPGYPLRGAVAITTRAGAPGALAHTIPAPGTVWVDPQLLDTLHLGVGSALRVGNRQFTIAALITSELDRGFAFVNFSPRVMLRADDLPSTGLLTFGSRATYRLLVAGAAPALANYNRWARQQLAGDRLRGVALESVDDGQPQVRDTLARARHFLTLVALLTAMLAAVAIAMAAHRYARRHLDGGAVMRCLGASRRTLRALFVLEFVLLGLAGSALGVVLGYAGHYVLLQWLGGLIGVSLPGAGPLPALQGVASGLVLLLGFALPPLAPLASVPPARVLRRDLSGDTRLMWLGYGLGLVLFGALLVLAAGELRLGLLVAGGFAAGLLGFAALARLALWALARWARTGRGAAGFGGFGRGAVSWRYALASLERRSGTSALQITALGIGLMCLLLLALTRNDLIAGWRASTPPDAPNQFVIDIQPDQGAAFQAFLASQGGPPVTLAPMIRGRLIARNGQAIGAGDYKDQNTKRLIEREFNLSYTAELPPDNRVVAGRWYGASTRAQISIEEGIAKSLKIRLGDVLRFDVAGQQIDAPVTSLRKLDWGTFRVNFFVVMPPAALADFPATLITSFHLGAAQHGVVDALVARFPNVTVIDAGALIGQLQRVLEQVIGAVQFLFLFTLAAGVLVLYAALAGTRDERVREAALLRALGATRRQVRGVQLAEFVVVGGLAGLMAALGAQGLGALLAQRVFEFHLTLNPWLPLLGVGGGIACAAAGGWASLRAVLARPALHSLREGL
jgi:putative ABC transport system permease protein